MQVTVSHEECDRRYGEAMQTIFTLSQRLSEAEAQRDAALEVLEPFAAWADRLERDPAAAGTGDACPITCNFQRIASGGDVTVGHFRAARDFIRRVKGGE